MAVYLDVYEEPTPDDLAEAYFEARAAEEAYEELQQGCQHAISMFLAADEENEEETRYCGLCGTEFKICTWF